MIATLAAATVLLQGAYTPGRYDMGVRLQVVDQAWMGASPQEKKAAVPALTRAVGGFFGGNPGEVCRQLDEARAILKGVKPDPVWAYTYRPTKPIFTFDEPITLRADLAYVPTTGVPPLPPAPDWGPFRENAVYSTQTRTIPSGHRLHVTVARDWANTRKELEAMQDPTAKGIVAQLTKFLENPDSASHPVNVAAWAGPASAIDGLGLASVAAIPFVQHKGTTFRVEFPPKDIKPVGVMIALHGAGGERDMFFESYGAGIWAKQALKQGYVFISPATSPAAPAAALDWLKTVRKFSPDRVVLVGHSMGGAAALGAAQTLDPKPDALILLAPAAGTFPAALKDVPTLLCVGEFELGMLKASAERMRTAVTETPQGRFDVIPNAEHLMVVADAALPAMAWLASIQK